MMGDRAMKISVSVEEDHTRPFGDLEAGEMFVGEYESTMIKLHEDTITDFLDDRPANAIFIEDGTGWNFDNGDEITVIKHITLEE
jgi:hypothetical protein